ncbi:hypothetical protein VPH35_088411 [Triticum aestivum]|uniref:uncharacterized protein n=1 Tax=Triticum aestivum TaxID=4565 RepID=UPI00194A9205|nr:uncharacterized protein LOC123115738 [Triticum aestivum]
MAADQDKPLKAARVEGREDHLARLPEDVLADVLRRVPPRWVAASRCVCRAWRDAIDAHGLLRADLLPLSFAGLLIHFDKHKYTEFFARPSAHAVSGNLSFLPSTAPHAGTIWDDASDWDDYKIQNHCNGLLLLSDNHVVNPAIRRWNALPPCPAKDGTWYMWYRGHLVYDPMVSPHYEVFMVPSLRDKDDPSNRPDLLMEKSEWPPSPCKMYVFSSRSGCWEEKYFIRQGDAAGIVSEMQVGWPEFRTAVYFRRALYIYSEAAFLMRISLSDTAYHVIKPPFDIKVKDCCLHTDIVSEKGVYFVAFEDDKCWLRVWILNESCGQMEWMLKHDKDLNPVLARHRFDQRVHGPWILEDINYNLFRSSHSSNEIKEASTEQIYEWNSNNDDDDVENCHQNKDGRHKEYDIQILGFHPHKEIVFMSESQETGLSYHLNGSKIEVLGSIYPKEYSFFKELLNDMEYFTSFPYTPCWIEEFPQNN